MIIIAECCQNHNGDFGVLREMIWSAKDAGADIVKIQSISSEKLTFRERFENGRSEGGKTTAIRRPFLPEKARLEKLDLSWDQQAKFVEECIRADIIPMTTAFTVESVKRISDVGFKNVKIASYDCASPHLIEEAAGVFDSVILSTGASYNSEIERACGLLLNVDHTLLHCVTIYPTKLSDLNLRRISYLRELASSVGLSDHTDVEVDGLLGTFTAIYFGIDVLERHYTIVDRASTRDGRVSIDPGQIGELREFSNLPKNLQLERLLELFPDYTKCYGEVHREMTQEELLNRDYYRGRFADRRADGTYRFNWEDT